MADIDISLLRQQLDRIEAANRQAGTDLATGGSGPHDPGGIEPRIAKLESDVGHVRSDLSDIKRVLERLAPRIDEMYGRQTLLVTKEDLSSLRIDIERRPTRRQTIVDIFSIVTLIGVVLAIGSRLAH